MDKKVKVTKAGTDLKTGLKKIKVEKIKRSGHFGTKANKKEYAKKRKVLLQKMRRYEQKFPNISIPRPGIPKFIDKGSIRKLERLSEKLSKEFKQGKLEKIYGEEKYNGPEGPSFEDIVLDDYMNYIMEAYDNAKAIEHFNNVNYSHLRFGSGANDGSLNIIRAHADHCMEMLHNITQYDEDKKKDVVWNLAHGTVEIYTETEVYIYGYQSIKEGEMGAIDVLHTIEELLTRAVTNRSMTQEEQADYYEIQSQFSDQGDIY